MRQNKAAWATDLAGDRRSGGSAGSSKGSLRFALVVAREQGAGCLSLVCGVRRGYSGNTARALRLVKAEHACRCMNRWKWAWTGGSRARQVEVELVSDGTRAEGLRGTRSFISSQRNIHGGRPRSRSRETERARDQGDAHMGGLDDLARASPAKADVNDCWRGSAPLLRAPSAFPDLATPLLQLSSLLFNSDRNPRST